MNFSKNLVLPLALILSCTVSRAAPELLTKNQNVDVPFIWQNATVYSVLIDRFANGDDSNDNSYGRPTYDASGHRIGTFHGGDLKGLTNKLDYIRSLGVNAIAINSPIEQSHGWAAGGMNGEYQNYAYHGYYGLDFTSIDANFGTIEEFRTFVDEAHKRGIRVLMDIVVSHSAYATLKDMCDFDFGTTSGASPCYNWAPNKANGENYYDNPIDYSRDKSWDRWWGKDWVVFDAYGEIRRSENTVDSGLRKLPKFKNTDFRGKKVTIPPFLLDKWENEKKDYDVPAARKYRSKDLRQSVAAFQFYWLSSWVEEFGIDGFICKNAKSLPLITWSILKNNCMNALEKWRNLHKSQLCSYWKDPFYMVGDIHGFTTDPGDKQKYSSQGGFDALVDYTFNKNTANTALTECYIPVKDNWEEYGKLYGHKLGLPALDKFTIISSMDTSLCRNEDMTDVAYKFMLLPGGIKIFYGDETARELDHDYEDQHQATRSDMNFPEDIDKAGEWMNHIEKMGRSFSKNETVSMWQKIGQFRLRNPAVGAGHIEILVDGSECRQHTNYQKRINNTVLIHLGDTSSVMTEKCFRNSEVLTEAITGKEYKVENGMIKGDFRKIALFERRK